MNYEALWTDFYCELLYMITHDINAISNHEYRECLKDIIDIMDAMEEKEIYKEVK